MITISNIQSDDFREFEGLTDYIEVLINSFPKPITRKELAQQIGVSQPAITKVKNRLLSLCDRDALVFNHKLILKTDETFWMLLVLYALKMKPTRILLSNYGWEMIKRMQIHSKISDKFKEYSLYFNERDTQIMTRIALFNLGNFQIVHQIRTRISNPQERMMLLSGQYISAMQTIMQKLDLPMDNAEDLLDILAIRDKLFYLMKDLISQQVKRASILQKLTSEEKTTYLKIYLDTIDFYLRKVFSNGTNFIKQTAEKRKLVFEEDYEKIGFFYSPPPK